MKHNHPQDLIFHGKGSPKLCPRCILNAAAPGLLAACRDALDYLENATSEDFSRGSDINIRAILGHVIQEAEGKP
jgi:hypothetical protein